MLDKARKKELSRIVVGVSSCLLGERVRYDGDHKMDAYIAGTLGRYFELRPFCPELAIGMGVPRKPIRLTRLRDNSIRCLQVENHNLDYTDALTACADAQRSWQQQLCGYILKKNSPSCGMAGVKVWSDGMRGSGGSGTPTARGRGTNTPGTEGEGTPTEGEGTPTAEGVGIYARRLMANLPWLPVEEEGRLGDAVLRQNFIRRVFAMSRWHKLIDEGITVAGFRDFHSRYKLALLRRDTNLYQRLESLIAAAGRENLQENADCYLPLFMAGLKKTLGRDFS